MPRKKKTGRKKGQKNGITPRKRKFIDYFIECDNATEAYIKAGYSVNGAGNGSHRLLKDVEIQKAIAERRQEIAKKADIKAQDVINELAKIAFANSEDFFEWGEQQIELIPETNTFKKVSKILIKPPDKINRDKKAAIASIRETAKGGLEFKFHDKIKALENLSKYFGTNTDAEVDKAKKIKGAEKQPVLDPTEGLDESTIDEQINKLEG